MDEARLVVCDDGQGRGCSQRRELKPKIRRGGDLESEWKGRRGFLGRIQGVEGDGGRGHGGSSSSCAGIRSVRRNGPTRKIL